jgi:hypothetical protein
VHRRNTFWSVGCIERIPWFLNTLRKEGFARVHRPRTGYSLILLEGLREKLSKDVNERCKECTKDTLSSSYKLKRNNIKFLEGH